MTQLRPCRIRKNEVYLPQRQQVSKVTPEKHSPVKVITKWGKWSVVTRDHPHFFLMWSFCSISLNTYACYFLCIQFVDYISTMPEMWRDVSSQLFMFVSLKETIQIHTNKAFRGNRLHFNLSRTDTVDLLRALSHQGAMDNNSNRPMAWPWVPYLVPSSYFFLRHWRIYWTWDDFEMPRVPVQGVCWWYTGCNVGHRISSNFFLILNHCHNSVKTKHN